ncbi:MAG TPA: alpha/beta hydrolase, partial [Acinetobacter nosocomialis]|nr:alpha/beta hydrolase [Acinetobacter nosocomialis]
GPGLGWHFGYFSFGDIAEKQIANDPNLFFSYFIKTYAGKKEIFTPELLAELIEPYSTRDKLKAAFGYYRSHADSIRQNEALLANGKKLTIPSMALTGQKGVNDVLVKEMRARFVADPAQYTAIILPDTGHWMVEENAEGVEKSLSNFLFK